MPDMKGDPEERLTSAVNEVMASARRQVDDIVDAVKREVEEIRRVPLAPRGTLDAGPSIVIPIDRAGACLVREVVIIDSNDRITDASFRTSSGRVLQVASDQLYHQAWHVPIRMGRYRAIFALLPIEEPKL